MYLLSLLCLTACDNNNSQQSKKVSTDISSTIITSHCADNKDVKFIYFQTQVEAKHTIHSKTKHLYSYPKDGILKPYWDIRYTNQIEAYMFDDKANLPYHAEYTGLDTSIGMKTMVAGTEKALVDTSSSVIQSKCTNGLIAGGTTLNLFDSPEQTLTYGGVQSTFTYQLHNNNIRPWDSNTKGNLLIQSFFDTPIYHNYARNIGASIAFNIFLYNPNIKQSINYIISLYAVGEAWKDEKQNIKYDPTTETVHIATVAHKDSMFSTLSTISSQLQVVHNTPNKKTSDDGSWDTFYRVNLSYNNVLNVLKKLQESPPKEVSGIYFGLSPHDWELTSVAIQYELEEEGGKASLSGSFRGFETHLSQHPL